MKIAELFKEKEKQLVRERDRFVNGKQVVNGKLKAETAVLSIRKENPFNFPKWWTFQIRQFSLIVQKDNKNCRKLTKLLSNSAATVIVCCTKVRIIK